MIFTLEDRLSDSPFVERIWCAQSERTGDLLSIAMSHWEMVVSRYQDKTYMTVRGPETKATSLPVTIVGTEFFGIWFKVGTVMPHLPTSTLVDEDVDLPDASSKSFWLNGSAWQFPSYENADTFVDRLVRQDLLARNPVVEAALQGQLKDLSIRTARRHFINTVGVIDYWKAANQTVDQGVGFRGGQIYYQEQGKLNYYVADSSLSAVAVLEKNARKDSTLSKKIYEDFLSLYTRYGGAVGGNTIGTRPNYEKLGVEFKTMELGGRLREYMVYVPQKARAAAEIGENVPLVFYLHGANMTMYSMFDFSRWWEIADEEGFILVFPTGLNTQNRTGWSTNATSIDMTYIQLLLDEMKANYNIDATRIYLGGQSAGNAMSQAIGRNLALSKNFTALGSTSFPTTSLDYSGEVLPFFMLFGEFDFWPYQLSTPAVGNCMTYWINRNDAVGTATTPASEETVGRYVIYKWNNVDGINVVRYGVTKGRGHSIIPDEMRMLWNWYELWQKDAEGNNVYVGP